MNVWATILGGFLAAGTGWFLQTRLEASRLKRIRELFVVGITDDLENSIQLYDRIKEDWDKSGIIWFTTINELEQSRHIYIKNKDWITLIEDIALRKKILHYYSRSGNHLVQLSNAQQSKYNIEDRYNKLVQEIRMRDSNISDVDARDAAMNTMDVEGRQLAYAIDLIPKLVNDLERYKSDAKEILLSLQGLK